MKKILITALLLIIGTGIAYASPSSVDRITDHIQPLISTDYVKGSYFVATSTTVASTFNKLTVTGTCTGCSTPAGINKDVQFNNSGSFGASDFFQFNQGTQNLTLGAAGSAGKIDLVSDTNPATERAYIRSGDGAGSPAAEGGINFAVGTNPEFEMFSGDSNSMKIDSESTISMYSNYTGSESPTLQLAGTATFNTSDVSFNGAAGTANTTRIYNTGGNQRLSMYNGDDVELAIEAGDGYLFMPNTDLIIASDLASANPNFTIEPNVNSNAEAFQIRGYEGEVSYIGKHGSAYFAQNVGIGTSSPYSKLSVAGQVVAANYVATTTATSTFAGGIQTNLLQVTSTTASSTFANGINLTKGCYAINNTCLATGGSGSGTVGSGTTGQFPFYNAAGTTLTATSSVFLAQNGNISIGTTTSYSKTTIWGSGTGTGQALEVANNASTTNFMVWDNGQAYARGNFGVGTTSPWLALSVNGSSDLGNNALSGSFTATSTAATSTFAGTVAIGNQGIIASNGGFAAGYNTKANASDAISATNQGAVAHGYVSGGVGGSTISATGQGSFATGYASAAGMGTTLITATGNGSFVMGAAGAGNITSSGSGSFAGGSRVGGSITSTGIGSFAYGDNINATANNTFALGTGFTNSTASTFGLGFGSQLLTVNATNVGIGTTSPYSRLSVAGQVVAANYIATSTTASVFPYASTTQISSINSAYFATAGGNVGVGTVNPTTRLHVVNSGGGAIANFQDTGNGNSWVTVGNSSLLTTFGSLDTSSSYFYTTGNLISYAGNAQRFNLTSTGGLSFGSTFVSSNPGLNNAIFEGNVGIGTTSPYATLSIQSGASTGDAFVVATTTNKQSFGIDNDGHQFTGGSAPVVSSCGTGSPSVVGDDQGGAITTGTAATSCTITFSKAYRSNPYIVGVSDNSIVVSVAVTSLSTSAATFSVSGAGLTGGVIYYSFAYHR